MEYATTQHHYHISQQTKTAPLTHSHSTSEKGKASTWKYHITCLYLLQTDAPGSHQTAL